MINKIVEQTHYLQFGKEWEKDMRRLKKDELIGLLKLAYTRTQLARNILDTRRNYDNNNV